MATVPENPAALADYDPTWATLGPSILDDVRHALGSLSGVDSAEFDHIGSTSVPGCAAKPFIDLQVRILPLPTYDQLSALLSPVGFEQALGARPDSPGVSSDLPRGDIGAPEHVWEKRLYLASQRSTILHIRRTDSPWASYTVWFRDWLRAHPEQRRRYEAVKRRLSEKSVGKADYDDYTRAKTAFFDEVQSEFMSWAQSNGA